MNEIEGDAPGTVTHWIEGLRAGDDEAARRLWQRYFSRLVSLARGKLHGSRRQAADEEDVALSAFDTFCRGAEEGRFPELADRDNLWRLLVVITARKAFDLIEREGRQKRGGGAVMNEAALIPRSHAQAEEVGLNQVIGREPTPAFAAQVAEEFQHLLDRLDDDDLRAAAIWKMEGHNNKEIAAKMGRSLRAVERTFQLIRKIWTEEGTP